MRPEDLKIIQEKICPLISHGEAALMLGAGFSYRNPALVGTLPSGDELRDQLLKECGKTPSARTNLKDAYVYASRNIPDFKTYLSNCFTVKKAHLWQEKIFQYVWSRIYTTNIDNVLDVAYSQARGKRRCGADFSFFNYSDLGVIASAIGSVPVISIHGTIRKLDEGFIFSNAEYGLAASRRVLDWHNELAAKMLTGGLIVIGNQLDESDIDTHLAARISQYGESPVSARNWIVMPDPDEIKKENYIAAGYQVIDATAEDFFNAIYAYLKPRGIGEILLADIPAVRKHSNNLKAMVWFKEAFNSAVSEIEKAAEEKGVFRHFITGSHPRWFFIRNDVHARTQKISNLTQKIGDLLSSHNKGLGILHVLGPSGSGKTTGIRSALRDLSATYPYIYEYDSENGLEIEYLYSILDNFTEKSIVVFYSASAFYYAINTLALRMHDQARPYVLFVLEERTNTYRKNKHHIPDCEHLSHEFVFGDMSSDDACRLAEKINELNVRFNEFSDYSIDKQARIILDKERGFRGDLLSTLFSLTTHENFEKKIYQEYHDVKHGLPKDILDIVAIISSLGFTIPLGYLSGFLGQEAGKILGVLESDLADVVVSIPPKMPIMCRHRVIADYYFKDCISRKGEVDLIIKILEFLSRQFRIEDIRHHPLPYQIYKNLISFNFLYNGYFSLPKRREYTEKTYHEAQRFFGQDSLFWLQFGRFYRKIGEIDSAIECFRTGLGFYDSFQAKHSLGAALLEKFVLTGSANFELFNEGVEILESERVRRGSSDPYPTTTLCSLLLDIVKGDPGNVAALEKLKETINYGLKYFKEDEAFQNVMRHYYRTFLPKRENELPAQQRARAPRRSR